ncbi:HEPN domain-containing protein [Pedobacter psychroterrae]|uniref:HEPN domain-containing protein n=1 Tax=Pedobacter psychroterrae TaxID=2530453 RepID=A0A4R0N9G1_9SPHI|nr:HEPN domain-containing protein [Pedobacter psychroterrae]TCC96790.1 HEPN domain-containing protein [Pedobacter psychroterrae]
MEIQSQQTGQTQKEHFSAFLRELVQKFNPETVYCFGKMVEQKTGDGCFMQSIREEKYTYFLLMVTESITRIEHEVQDFANQNYPHGTITLLVHGRETVVQAIKANNRFFIMVCNSGQIIYSRNGMLEPSETLSFIPTQGAVKAQKHFDHRMPLATGFLASANECLKNGQYGVCAFMAHQVTEQCCILLIRIYLAYRSDMHNLYRQLRLCNSFSTAPHWLFLSGGEDEKRLFDIMVRSYSAARYKDDFRVSQKDAEQLFINVSNFIKLTEILCVKKIESLAEDAEAYKQNKLESGAENG